MIGAPKRKLPRLAQRRVEGQRLAYYTRIADSEFWDQHWAEHLTPEIYSWAGQGDLGIFEEPFTRYLPQRGWILEAGCGLGQYVLALHVRGYECEGVEWGMETVQAVRSMWPDLPIRVGNVTQLDVPDGYYRGYLSLGVIEHRREGPESFLREAYRVLSDDGVMLVSVPHFHRLRRSKAHLGFYRDQIDGSSFYQYAFTVEEMSAILRREGFVVVDTFGYDSLKGIKDEIALVRYIVKVRFIARVLKRLFRSWRWVNQELGHMMLFICCKDPASRRKPGVSLPKAGRADQAL